MKQNVHPCEKIQKLRAPQRFSSQERSLFLLNDKALVSAEPPTDVDLGQEEMAGFPAYPLVAGTTSFSLFFVLIATGKGSGQERTANTEKPPVAYACVRNRTQNKHLSIFFLTKTPFTPFD